MELYAIPAEDGQVTSGGDSVHFIIFRPLSRLAFIGNGAMLQLARGELPAARYPQAEAFLEEIGFYQPDPEPPPPPNLDFDPTAAVLLMTNQCQLRCTYCYAAAGEQAARPLPFEHAQATIDYVVQQAHKKGRSEFRVSFHGGGEPAFDWQLLQACVRYARQQDLPARISLTSNGIWSPEMTGWILEHIDHVSLSMDGRPETQNHQRPLASGAPSAPIVMRTVAELDRHQFSYGIRLTATLPWDNLPKDVRFICEQTGCPGMQVEPAFNTQRGGHVQPDEDNCIAFVEAYLEALQIATQAGRRLYFAGARVDKLTSSFCGAPNNALIVNAAGDLVTCYQIDSPAHPLASISTIGHVREGEVWIDPAARAHLRGLFEQRREACRECFCYWNCAGDCYTRTFQPGPEGHLVYSHRCTINRYLSKRMLLDYIERSGGVWHGQHTLRSSHDA